MLDLIHFSLPLRLSVSIQKSFVSLFFNFTAVKNLIAMIMEIRWRVGAQSGVTLELGRAI